MISETIYQKIQNTFRNQPFMQLLGVTMTELSEGKSTLTFSYTDELAQQNKFLHAGVLTSVADTACGMAALTLLPESYDILAVEFKINLMKPAIGTHFAAKAEVLQSGKKLSIVRCDIYNNQEKLIATMTNTLFNVCHE
jgi:uncharacterized protein (TIGR00369 family)